MESSQGHETSAEGKRTAHVACYVIPYLVLSRPTGVNQVRARPAPRVAGRFTHSCGKRIARPRSAFGPAVVPTIRPIRETDVGDRGRERPLAALPVDFRDCKVGR